MRIGYDVSQTAEDMAGCGFFSKQIISHIVEMDRENEYLLYPAFYGYRHPNYKNAYTSNAANVKSLFLDTSWTGINKVWMEQADKAELLGHPDIIHSNNFSFPTDCNAKVVMTIYDMGYLDCPEFTTEANRLVCYHGAFEASLYADHIVTISEFSKQSFLKYFPYYPEDRISVVYLGNRSTLSKVVDYGTIQKVYDKFGIPHSTFWLGVGTIEPRKNYTLLLEAYSEIVKEDPDSLPLYIAGGKGWLEEGIQERVRSLGIENKIRFLGYVSDEELSVLYSTCHAFIYPSLYEGFGLPVLEAMSCGATVITSNVSSLPEVAGDACLMINPNDVNTLIDAMKILNSNETVRNDLLVKSEAQIKKFSWSYAARDVLNIYDKVMSSEPWRWKSVAK